MSPEYVSRVSADVFGLTTPAVKKSKVDEIEIESDTAKSRIWMSVKKRKGKAGKDEDGDDDDDDDTKVDEKTKGFLVTRNVIIDRDNGIFRVTEEIGRNGEWRLGDKQLIASYSEENRHLITSTRDRPRPSVPSKHKDKMKKK